MQGPRERIVKALVEPCVLQGPVDRRGDRLDFDSQQRRIIADAARWLAPGGALLIETSEGQSPQTAEAFAAAGFATAVRHSDDFDSTIVIGTLPLH